MTSRYGFNLFQMRQLAPVTRNGYPTDESRNTVRYMSMDGAAPHPTARPGFIDVWVYTCPRCDPDQVHRAGWYIPCSEDGRTLFCRWHAPQREYPSTNYKGEPFTARTTAYLWCRRGWHVTGERCGEGAHITSRTRTPEPRACQRCGETFTPTRSDARFCSARCRVAAHRAAAREVEAE